MVRPRALLLVLCGFLAARVASWGFVIVDDAYITFRYARHLSRGDGLVYNVGERVEGYTNFLWVLISAAFQAAGLAPEVPAVLAATLAGMGVVATTWVVARRVMGGREWESLVAAAVIVATGGVSLDIAGAMETALFVLLVTGAIARTLREAAEPEARPWSGLLFGLAALTRPEGVLAWGLVQALRLPPHRTETGWAPSRQVLAGWAAFAGIVGAHTAFRLAYYGDLVPNTFHAKVGWSVEQAVRGWWYVAAFFRESPTMAVGAAAGWLLMAPRAGRDLAARIAVVLPLAWCAYVVAVGGDWLETHRFLHPVLPLLATLVAVAVAEAANRARRAGGLVAVGVFAAGIATLDVPRSQVRCVQGAAVRHANIERRLTAGVWLRTHVPPDTLVAVHSAGALPFASDLPTIDMWGLTDAQIARGPVTNPGATGHEKTDYVYTFSREPDLYLPEDSLLTDAPVRLPVPSGFPADFEQHYKQYSMPVGDRWLNMFVRLGGRVPLDG